MMAAQVGGGGKGEALPTGLLVVLKGGETKLRESVIDNAGE